RPAASKQSASSSIVLRFSAFSTWGRWNVIRAIRSLTLKRRFSYAILGFPAAPHIPRSRVWNFTTTCPAEARKTSFDKQRMPPQERKDAASLDDQRERDHTRGLARSCGHYNRISSRRRT